MPEKLNLRGWSPELPTEEGFYWFYGEPWMGQMGRDFQDDYVSEPEMYLARVHKNLIVMSGNFVSSRPFNKEKRQEGWLGYWAKATLPESPYDGNSYFK